MGGNQPTPHKAAIYPQWTFKLKRDETGAVVSRKAQLVAKGCFQTYGVDYLETFVPVVRLSTIGCILLFLRFWDWKYSIFIMSQPI